jgi:hypothetical protein
VGLFKDIRTLQVCEAYIFEKYQTTGNQLLRSALRAAG